MKLLQRLVDFKMKNEFAGRGKLGLALVVTRKAKSSGLPIDPGSLLTPNQGQVSGLSGSAINKILKEYGVTRSIGTEAGRTSRGTVGAAQEYAEFLNSLYSEGLIDLNAIERWWADRIIDYFNSQPFKLNYDQSRTLRAMIQDLLDQAVKRQREAPGTTYVGAVLQHMVGAKLTLALPEITIAHHGFAVADAVSARSGDFVIDDAAIHCTTAPTEALLAKCRANLQASVRPIILTIGKGMEAAEVMAETKGIAGRVEIMDAIQFLAANLYELSLFKTSERRITIEKLVERYNQIVDAHEPDPSLKISID
jgi:hypothetical protein